MTQWPNECIQTQNNFQIQTTVSFRYFKQVVQLQLVTCASHQTNSSSVLVISFSTVPSDWLTEENWLIVPQTSHWNLQPNLEVRNVAIVMLSVLENCKLVRIYFIGLPQEDPL